VEKQHTTSCRPHLLEHEMIPRCASARSVANCHCYFGSAQRSRVQWTPSSGLERMRQCGGRGWGGKKSSNANVLPSHLCPGVLRSAATSATLARTSGVISHGN